MMKTLKAGFMAGSMALWGFSSPIEAQQQTKAVESSGQTVPEGEEPLHLLSELTGIRAVDGEGAALGEVKDVAVASGRVTFFIVSAQGGDSSELYPVPSEHASLNTSEDRVKLQVKIDQQRWQQAPTLPQDQVAQLQDPEQAREIHQFYEQQPRDQQQQYGAGEGRQRNEQQQSQGESPDQPV